MIEIVEIHPDDWKRWRQLRLAALEEAPEAFGSKLADWQDASEERWRNRLGLPRARQIMAFSNAEPAGMAGGIQSDSDREIVEVVSMWVLPKHRGRGIGDALMDAVEKWACGIGARTLKLEVTGTNISARGLYARNGFDYTPRANRVESNEEGIELIMVKTLEQ